MTAVVVAAVLSAKSTGLHRHVAAIDDAHLAAGEEVRSEVVVVVGQERHIADGLGADAAGAELEAR